MRMLLVLLAASCLLSAASGQVLETTLVLPDSLSGQSGPEQVLYNSVNNTVYVGGSGRVIVVLDAVSSLKLARIPLPGRAFRMCHNPVENKVYVIEDYGDEVYVIDAAANRFVSTVSVGTWVYDLCYNPTMNRIYCSGEQATAIDCSTDSVVATIDLPYEAENIDCSPVNNKVYCVMHSDDVAVIDCTVDSIIKTFYSGAGGYHTLYNPLNNRLYISEVSDEDVTIVDCDRDSVLGWTYAGDCPGEMCLNTRDNKIYVADEAGGWLAIIDGRGDSLLRWRFIGGDHGGIIYDSANNLVHLVLNDRDSLAALDGTSDSVEHVKPIGDGPMGLCYNPRQRYLYTADHDGATVSMLRAISGNMLAQQRLWFPPYQTEYRRLDGQLYCWNGSHSSPEVGIVSPGGSPMQWFIPLPGYIDVLRYCRENDRLYGSSTYTGDSSITVIHCWSDSVVRIEGAGAGICDFCMDTVEGKVYCPARNDSLLVVLDAEEDTVITRISVGFSPFGVAYVPEYNRAFVAVRDADAVRIIDGHADSILASVPVAAPELLASAPDLQQVWCASTYSGLLTALAADSFGVIGTVPVPAYVTCMLYSRANHRLYVTTLLDDAVEVIYCPTLQRVASIPVGPQPRWLALDTFANRLYCVSDNGDVALIDCRNDAVIGTLATGQAVSDVTWSQGTRNLFVSHAYSSSISVVVDTLVVGVVESGQPTASSSRPSATVIRGVLTLSPAASLKPQATSLLDPAGRRVMVLQPGANDVSRLPAGVYFVREEPQASSHKPQAVTKVVIQH